MYQIGVQFESSPVHQDRLQKVTGSTPPIPSPPNKWPTRTVLDSQTILELQMENDKKTQEINIKTCTITELETAVQDLEEDLQMARSRIEAFHADMAVLRQANLDLRKINSESLKIRSKKQTQLTSPQPKPMFRPTKRGACRTSSKKKPQEWSVLPNSNMNKP